MKTANILVYGYITVCMDMFLITKILDLAYVQNYMRSISQNKSDTKLFRVFVHCLHFVRSLRSLNREDSDKYTLTITYLKEGHNSKTT